MASSTDLLIAHSCIENLIGYDETGAPMPWLATGWEVDQDTIDLPP